MSRRGIEVNPMEGTVDVASAEAKTESTRRRRQASRRMVPFVARRVGHTTVGTKDRKAEPETANCVAGSEEPNNFTVRLFIKLQVAANLVRGTHPAVTPGESSGLDL